MWAGPDNFIITGSPAQVGIHVLLFVATHARSRVSRNGSALPVDLPFDASDSVEIFEAQRHIGMRMDLHTVSKSAFWLKTEAESPPRPRDEL